MKELYFHSSGISRKEKEEYMQNHIESAERKARLKDLDHQEVVALAKQEEARKNRDFTQVYPRGWNRIIDLAKGNSSAAALYAWFAQHIDPGCGAVICDQQFLADQFKVTTRTIRNWLTYLENHEAIIRIPVSGRVHAYALDPAEVWKGYNTGKDYAAFTTKTLINKDEAIQRRIQLMIKSKTQRKEIQALEENGQQEIEDL